MLTKRILEIQKKQTSFKNYQSLIVLSLPALMKKGLQIKSIHECFESMTGKLDGSHPFSDLELSRYSSVGFKNITNVFDFENFEKEIIESFSDEQHIDCLHKEVEYSYISFSTFSLGQ